MKVPEILQMETPHAPGSLASVINVLVEMGLVLEHLNVVRSDQNRTLWEFTIEIDESVQADLFGRLNALSSARFVGWSERAFERHRSGKIDQHAVGPPQVSGPQLERP